MKIVNTTKNSVLADKAGLADTFSSRMTGLLGRMSLGAGEALVITRCNSIHMFFMRFAIDVIFVSSENIIVGLKERIKPFRLSPVYFASSYAVELPAGTIAATKTAVGDRIRLDG